MRICPQEILVNITGIETRVAVVEQNLLAEIYIERSNKSLVGNIYKGRVIKVLNGMQSAFIDIGLEKAGFLHIKDIHISDFDVNTKKIPQINSLLHEGQNLFVQVIKEPVNNKGARLSTQLSIATRDLVFMPYSNNIGVSLKIENQDERERLKKLLINDSEQTQGGYIIRTTAENAESFKDSVNYAQKVWKYICDKSKIAGSGAIVYEELDLVLRTLRDLVNNYTIRVSIDCEKVYLKALDFVEEFMPELKGKLELYTEKLPIFDLYKIDEDIEKALSRRVNLKSGGYLIFDQNEAMTTIDVNTGSFVGGSSLNDTIFHTNLEAASVIARQIRLRNIGGIIIIDFIDMCDEEHRIKVFEELAKKLEFDYAKTSISDFSKIGLIQMTRKRTRESLENSLCELCHICHGKGKIKTVESVCFEIFRSILKANNELVKKIFILASPPVIESLEQKPGELKELIDTFGDKIITKRQEHFSREQYDVVLV